MMKLKDFNFFAFLFFLPFVAFTQVKVFGEIFDKSSINGLASVEIYNEFGEILAVSNSEGSYNFTSSKMQ